jgi:hypothetical protein
VAYEWIGTVILGLGGIASTLIVAKQGREHVERMAGANHDHERTMAREARDQERFGNAYMQLLVMVERAGQWAQMVNPMRETDPPQPVPPGLDEQAEAEALVDAFGSDEARKAFESWREVFREMPAVVGEIGSKRAAGELNEPTEGGFGQPYLRLEELRKSELEARKALARLIRAELRLPRAS